MRDSEIEQRVLHELRLEAGISTKELCVFCRDGIATISGTVNSHKEKLTAQKASERAAGVLMVVNKIKVSESTWPVTQTSSTDLTRVSRSSAVQRVAFATTP